MLKKLSLGLLFGLVLSIALFTNVYAQELKFEPALTFGAEGTGPGQFKYVEDFAFDKKGNILVTDAAHAFVQVFDKKNRQICFPVWWKRRRGCEP